MFYRDLTFQRVGSDIRGYTVYPSFRSIGWLSPDHEFSKGKVTDDFLNKLRNILFIPTAHAEDMKMENVPDVLLDFDQMRAPPIPCPICGKHASLNPDNLCYYSGSNPIKLGDFAMTVPSLVDGEGFYFPSLIYHFVQEHGYSPPLEFVNSVLALDFLQPYDASKFHKDMPFFKVSAQKMNELDKEIVG